MKERVTITDLMRMRERAEARGDADAVATIDKAVDDAIAQPRNLKEIYDILKKEETMNPHKEIEELKKELRAGFDDDGVTWLDMIVVEFHADMARNCSESGIDEQIAFIAQYLGSEDAAVKWMKERLENDG